MPSPLSNVSVTSARLRAGLVVVPEKITSLISFVRRLEAACVPSTHDRASTRLDLPEPLGPTTTFTPDSNSSRVRSAKDLKPVRDRDLRCKGIGSVSPPVGTAWHCQERDGAWQAGHQKLARCPTMLRSMGVRHRRHGSPSLPYAASRAR